MTLSPRRSSISFASQRAVPWPEPPLEQLSYDRSEQHGAPPRTPRDSTGPPTWRPSRPPASLPVWTRPARRARLTTKAGGKARRSLSPYLQAGCCGRFDLVFPGGLPATTGSKGEGGDSMTAELAISLTGACLARYEGCPRRTVVTKCGGR